MAFRNKLRNIALYSALSLATIGAGAVVASAPQSMKTTRTQSTAQAAQTMHATPSAASRANESRANDCVPTAANPCPVKTYQIDSPIPTLDRSHIIKHTCDNRTLDTELAIASTHIEKSHIPYAERFATVNGKVYVTSLAPGEEIILRTPQGDGIGSYMPSRWNSADELTIGNDFKITYDELMSLPSKRFEGVYDVVLQTQDPKDCASYKIEIVAYPGTCDYASSVATPSTASAGFAQQGTAISSTTSTISRTQTETPKEHKRRLKAEAKAQREAEHEAKRARAKEERAEERAQRDATAAQDSYKEVTIGIGKGSDTIDWNGGATSYCPTNVSFDTKSVPFSITSYKPNTMLTLNGRVTQGNDAGAVQGPYGYNGNAVKENATNVVVQIDAKKDLIGKFGLGVSGAVGYENSYQYIDWFGETARQNNMFAEVCGNASYGDYTRSFFQAGLCGVYQPVENKTASPFTGVPYTASGSHEFMPEAKLRLRLMNDARTLYTDITARYMPSINTVWTSGDAVLDQKNSNATSLAVEVGIGKEYGPGVALRVRSTHNSADFVEKLNKSIKAGTADRSSIDASVLFRYTWK